MSLLDHDVKQYEFIKRVEEAYRKLSDMGDKVKGNGMKFDEDTYAEFIDSQTALIKLATEMREREMEKEKEIEERESREKIEVALSPEVLSELRHMVLLHKLYGAAFPVESVEHMAGDVLSCVADGSRRPGAWERSLLEMMGLVADENHDVYRSDYGG